MSGVYKGGEVELQAGSQMTSLTSFDYCVLPRPSFNFIIRSVVLTVTIALEILLLGMRLMVFEPVVAPYHLIISCSCIVIFVPILTVIISQKA